MRYFPTLQSLDLARNDLEQQLGEDRGDRDVVWPHRVEVRPERRSSSVERRSSGVPQPTPRLPRARSEPRRNAPKLGGCGCGLLMVLCCGAGLKTPFSHENGGLEDDISLQGGHFPLP